MSNLTLNSIFKRLLNYYGPQGWWPLYSKAGGYSEYKGQLPSSFAELFEISAGAVLAQNVSWKNAEKAVARLKTEGILDPEKLLNNPGRKTGLLIRSSGYYNQKTIKLKNLSSWFISRGYTLKKLKSMDPAALRQELLSIKGIGPETADSILLYGLDMKYFVVDAYLKRIFSRLGLLEQNVSYDTAQEFCHRKFKGSTPDYREFHALIVCHAVTFCKKKPACEGCIFSGRCTDSRL